MNGPCRCVPVVALARKPLKTLRRAGCRAGACRSWRHVCNPLKTLSVAVRAGACVWNPLYPHRAQGGELGLALGGSRHRNRRPRRRETAVKWAVAYRPATELKPKSNTRG
jgi:hypothetical protein